MTIKQTATKTMTYSSGLAITALCASTSEYALGLLAIYYGSRQLGKLGRMMS